MDNNTFEYFDSSFEAYFNKHELVLFRNENANTYTFLLLNSQIHDIECGISEWIGRFEKFIKEQNPGMILKACGKRRAFSNLKKEIENLCNDDSFTLSTLEQFATKHNCSEETMICDIVEIKLESVA